MLKLSLHLFASRSALFALVGSMALSLIVGCGFSADKKVRKSISGTVKYKGVPLAYGSIRFTPTADSKASTSQEATIKDGKYEILTKQGLEPGKYQVSINSADPRDEDPGDNPRAPGDNRGVPPPLPPKYNSQTKLEREVKPSDQNTFDFDLK